MKTELQPMSTQYDPWESIHRRQQFGRNILTSVEFTVTNLCNLRCEHCAVGDVLTMKESSERIPLSVIYNRLDEIETLDTLSITGGEPMYNKSIIEDYIVPIFRYAHERGVRTQINSNLTLDLERYEAILPYLDVLHISFNYLNAEDFYKIAYVHSNRHISFAQGEKTYQRMVENTIELSKRGAFVSAESLISEYTKDKLPAIHHKLKEMGCQRHEVHPLYPSDFAKGMKVLTLQELRQVYHRLLDERNPDLWILFGTLPYYACNEKKEDLDLIRRIFDTPNVTVRNDPDGHNRLNTNIFTGEVIVTDFGDVEPLGNIKTDSFQHCFDSWQNHSFFQKFNCYCPQSKCNGPHILVANTYYKDQDFTKKSGISL
jgi:radical SAM/CxCxxxxC motif protein YfkAB